MKVILCEDVDNLGHMGETVNVAPGYARNFLLPRRFAVHSDSASAKQIEHELRIIKKREEKLRKEMMLVKGRLDGIKLEFTARAGEDGKLFGSITSLHIAQKLDEFGHDVDRKKIQLKDHIKTLGNHEVKVRMMKDLDATITVTVIADAAPVAVVEPMHESHEEAESMAAAETTAAD